jgi:hypothetical protein
MSEAHLPVAVPDKYRRRWSDRGHLRWLGWLLQFQGLDLARLRLEEQRGLCENIMRFCSAYPFGLSAQVGVLRSQQIEGLSLSVVRSEIKKIHKHLRQGFQSLIVGEKLMLADPKNILPPDFEDPSKWETLVPRLWQLPIKSINFSLWRSPEYKSSRGDKPRRFKSGAVEYVIRAGWPDIFWLAVADLLRIYGDRIRQCQRVSCGKIFIRTKRQDYCSAQCSQSARSKKYYVANRAKATKKRRDRYEQKLKVEHGQNVQVRHREAR